MWQFARFYQVSAPGHVAFAVFDYEEPVEVEARVRYRINPEGLLSFKLSFVKRADMIQRDALLSIAENIGSELNDLMQYEGKL